MYSVTVLACALIAFSELGYGFGYEEAKTLADEMASLLIQTQLGYPYTLTSPPQFPTGYEGLFLMEKSISKWEKSNESQLINRPELAGACPPHYKFDTGGRVMAAPRMESCRRFFCGTFNKPLFVYILCNKLELALL